MAFAPEHFGNPLREQALLAQGQAWAWLSRDVVEVSGADRLSYLTTVSSQVLTDLENDGQSRQVLFLDANGHILYAALAVSGLVSAPAEQAAPGEQSVLLLVDAGCGEGLAQLLNSRRFMLRVQAQVRPDLQVAGAIGDGVQKLAGVVENLVTTSRPLAGNHPRRQHLFHRHAPPRRQLPRRRGSSGPRSWANCPRPRASAGPRDNPRPSARPKPSGGVGPRDNPRPSGGVGPRTRPSSGLNPRLNPSGGAGLGGATHRGWAAALGA